MIHWNCYFSFFGCDAVVVSGVFFIIKTKKKNTLVRLKLDKSEMVTWLWLWPKARVDLEGRQRLLDASCAACERSLPIPCGRPRAVFAAWPVRHRVSCWSRSATTDSSGYSMEMRRKKKWSIRSWITWLSHPPSASSKRSCSWITWTLRSALSRSTCTQKSRSKTNENIDETMGFFKKIL